MEQQKWDMWVSLNNTDSRMQYLRGLTTYWEIEDHTKHTRPQQHVRQKGDDPSTLLEAWPMLIRL